MAHDRPDLAGRAPVRPNLFDPWPKTARFGCEYGCFTTKDVVVKRRPFHDQRSGFFTTTSLAVKRPSLFVFGHGSQIHGWKRLYRHTTGKIPLVWPLYDDFRWQPVVVAGGRRRSWVAGGILLTFKLFCGWGVLAIFSNVRGLGNCYLVDIWGQMCRKW